VRRKTFDIYGASVKPVPGMPAIHRIGVFTFLLFNCCLLSVASEVARDNSSAQIGDDLTPRFIIDETYKDECGSCHIAYPPMLLPTKSWQKLMSGLEDHFDESADLDSETVAHILDYLNQHSLETESGSIVSHWQETIPDKPPIRITELSIFLSDHKEPYKLLGDSAEEPGFFAPCRDCHKEAEDGIFSKDRLFRGNRGVFRRFSDIE